MTVDLELSGKLIRRFEYPWQNKWFDGPFISVFIILIVGQLFAYPEYGVEGNSDGLITTWLIAAPLSILVFIAALREILIHQPIEFYENGISAVTVNKGLVQWGFPKREFVRWTQINRLESFAYPDWDSSKNNSGIRLWVKERRIRIYQELKGFTSILKLLQDVLPDSAILNRLVDHPGFGPQSGKVIGTYPYKFGARYFVVSAMVMLIAPAILFSWIGISESITNSGVFYLKPNQITGLLIIWGCFGGMALFAFFMGRIRYVLLQPIVLTDEGIKGPLNDRKHRPVWYWQKAPSVFFRWTDIDVIVRFSFKEGDIESKIMLGVNGLSIMAGFNRMAIFEDIHNFSEIKSILQEKLPHLAFGLNDKENPRK